MATLALTPLAGRLARSLGVLDQPAANKYHQQATPYLGGLAVAVGLVLVGGVAAGAQGQLFTVVLGGLALAIVGLLDDRFGVGPRVKLAVEVAAGIALWLSGVGAGLFGVEALDMALTVLWVVGITNAVNLLDNMDGLCAGVTAIAAGTFFAIAAIEGHYFVAALALAVAGSSLGFLRHNFPPARIFLGDAGTLLLGFLLAALGLKLDLVGENGFVRSAVPILVLGVPVFDTVLVVIARLLGGRRIYVGNTDHSSHRLARLGLSPRRVALSVYGAQVILSGLALVLLYRSMPAGLAVVGASVLAALGALRFFLGVESRLQDGTEETVVLTEEPQPLGVVRSDAPVEYEAQ
ncbi:MAG TPA: MraY family glycosyltransferase [Actinomycetota bacterium]|nr:MraY family glycosyltransferase [Actinomycetota bacterium]